MQRLSIFCSVAGYLWGAVIGLPAFGQEMSPPVSHLPEIAAGESRAAVWSEKNPDRIKIFMCGDVMTGRGIDQALPHPSDPLIHESYLKSASGYIEIAEAANGPIHKPVSFDYIWGDALAELQRAAPQVKLINLETSITVSNAYWKAKGIHYRMHPHNIASLTAAGIDVCALANNHVLDWGYAGLTETLAVLKKVNIKTAGAGADARQAGAPAVINVGERHRVIVFSFGLASSGIPSG